MKYDQSKIETQVTDTIMMAFSAVDERSIIKLPPKKFNKVYSHIYEQLSNLGLSKRLAAEYDAVNDYQKRMRSKYKNRVDSLREIFPNGMFTKDRHGEFVGINVMLSKIVSELSEVERSKGGWVSVEDRFPDEGQEVLIFWEGHVCTAKFTRDPRYMQGCGAFRGYAKNPFNSEEAEIHNLSTSHWRPLPESPEK